MRKNSLLGPATALCFIFFVHTAGAKDIDSCASYPDVPVNVKVVFDEPKYDFTKNLASVQAIANGGGQGIPENDAITMGITRYQSVLEFQAPTIVHTAPGQPACAYVQHIDATIGYRDVTVFVASEIPQGSCAFDETIGHEQKHIAVNRHILDEFVPLIEERLKDYLRLNGVIQVENADRAEKVLRDKLKSIMAESISQIEEENLRRQRDVDSEEEYNRLAHVCDGALGKIAGQYHPSVP